MATSVPACSSTRNRRVGILFVLAETLALAGAGCGSSASTATGPTPVKCQVALTPPPGAIDAAGGTGNVVVSTQAECSWTASADVSWITSFSPVSGQGGGQIQFQVAPNPNPSPRQGRISLNGTTAPVSQSGAACAIQLTPTSATIAADGGTGSVSVSTLAGCAWTATSGAPWVTIISDSSGSGNGTVDFSVATNTGGARATSLTIGGQTFAVTQPAPGATQCNFAIQPTSQSMTPAGGTTTVAVEADAACSWTAASNVAWLALVGSGTGSGNGSVTISASANTGPSRTGTATIAGQIFTVTQAGSCSASIDPTSTSLTSAGGSGSTTVTAAAGCAWTATTADTWITLTAGASGSGNGTVDFTVAANTGAARTGTITIAGQAFTVNQAAGCASSINPTSQSIGAGGGAATPVDVTTAAACVWAATTADTWITITGGASGSGNGTVAFTVAANPGPARTGTLDIAGQTHTVSQATGCTYSINPTNESFNKNQTTSSVTVTAGAGCTWTATSNDSWITVDSGATGTGNGTVTYSITRNTGSSPRVGTLTIAGMTFTVTQSN